MTIEEKETVIACILNFEQIICFLRKLLKWEANWYECKSFLSVQEISNLN